jgi:hypothetical protein
MAGERIINRNPYLYGPGPGHLSPKGTMSLLRKIASLRRVHHGCRPQVIALLGKHSSTLLEIHADPWH